MALSNTSFFDYSQETMKACIGILDIAGAYLVLGFASGSFEVRILAVALGNLQRPRVTAHKLTTHPVNSILSA